MSPLGADRAVLEVNGLSVRFEGRAGSRTIVSGLELIVHEGETVGIVGESGSGKSISARAIIGLLPPRMRASGRIVIQGRCADGFGEDEWCRIRGDEVTLLPQDPLTMLNPVARIGAQIVERMTDDRGRRLRGSDARRESARRLSEVGLDETVARRFPFELSGGMRQRVGLAAALANDPALLIADEPTSAIDVVTQREILNLLQSTQRRRGMALILITHDLGVAFSVCDRIVVMYAGRILEQGPASSMLHRPQHPYTFGLLMSEPDPHERVGRLAEMPGRVPEADEVGDECAFADRCTWVAPVCRRGRPPLSMTDSGRYSACVRLNEIAGELDSDAGAAEAETEDPSMPAAGSASLIVVQDLVKTFKRREGEHTAVAGVEITVSAGETVAVVGQSGSGKTTLARCIVGLERADRGSIWIDGVDASNRAKLQPNERRRLQRTVQMVFQDPYSSLNPMRTVGATIAEVLRLTGRPAHAKAVGDALRQVGLGMQYASRRPAALSGGERQRVAIARALAAGPRVLICDEAVSALDVSVRAQILNLLKDLQSDEGLSYLFITHDLAVARQVADKIYVMLRGEVAEFGSADQVLTSPRSEYTKNLLASSPSAISSARSGT